MLGGTQVGYPRMTRRWWAPARATLDGQGLLDAPLYFVSSNTHSLSNLVTGLARAQRGRARGLRRARRPDDLQEELSASARARAEGSWENFLYFVRADYAEANPAAARSAAKAERAAGVEHLRSHTALRVAAQVIPLGRARPAAAGPAPGRRRRRAPRAQPAR